MMSEIGIRKPGRWLMLAGCMLLSAGCDHGLTRKATLDEIDQSVAQAAATNSEQQAIPQDVADALLPTIDLDRNKTPIVKDTQYFDISVNDVPAQQFFMSLVDGTNYNMVVHPEVAGRITLNLKKVSIPQVMEAVRDVYGYEFVQTAYGFQVLPSRLSARIYQINYLNVRRSGSSSTFVSSGALTSGPNAPQTGQSSAGNESTNTQGTTRSNVVGTQISTEQVGISFWNELRTSIAAIIGNGEGRSVVVNPQSGVVVVRAIPNEQREVEAYLRATQLIVERQVILEAKVIEVELKDGYQSGINWAALKGEFTAAHAGGGSVLVNESGTSDIAGQAGATLRPGGTPALDGTLSSAFGGVFSLAVNANNFTAFVELLKTQGNVQVLSSPRVSTMNNQKALIKVGSDEFFVTDVSTTTVTGTSTTSTPNVELTPFFSGIALDVTPQISQDDEVTLHIHPSVSKVVDQQKNITVGGISQQLPLARSTVRESDSIVRARSGQIIVIGGLMQDRTDDQDAKTPVLGDLPIFGKLFKHQKQSSLKSELVILLRPLVVGGAEDWTQELAQSQQRLGQMRQVLKQRDDDAARFSRQPSAVGQ